MSRIVQASVARVGFDPTLYSGHSLRAGFVTSAAATGARDDEIMFQSGHKDARTMHGYICRGTLFDTVVGRLGL